MPFVAFYHTHKLVVTLFVLIYLVKAILLLLGNKEALARFNKLVKIPEMVISLLFFATGLVMLSRIANFNTLFAIKLTLVVLAIPLAVMAYRKASKVMAVLAVLLLFSAYGLAEMYKAQFAKKHEVTNVVTDPQAANYDLYKHGEALFKAQCTVCHGDDGKASLSGAKDLTLSTKNDAEIEAIIKNGKNTMPKMANIYNEQELKALVAYVKGFR